MKVLFKLAGHEDTRFQADGCNCGCGCSCDCVCGQCCGCGCAGSRTNKA